MSSLLLIKKYVVSLTTSILQAPKIESHPNQNFNYKVASTDKCFFTHILFMTSITPCET